MFTSDDDVALYKDAYSPFWGEKEEILVSAAVAPNTAEEVSQVVRIANTLQIPIYPDLDRQELGLRRLRAKPLGKRCPRLEAHEPDHRSG